MPLWKRNLYLCWFGSFATAAGMSLVLPFLPLYIGQLGIRQPALIVQWSGIAFGATFLLAALASPVWGRLADRYGRKPMLLRASLGMAIIMSLMGLVHNVYELVALRFLMGAVSGYISAAITMIATQTPREYSGWALGTLSTGTVTGNLTGPLIGGWLAEVIGLRHTFFVTGVLMFIAFVVTLVFVKETFERKEREQLSTREVWSLIPRPQMLFVLFLTTFMLQLANMSIEPIITIYIKELIHNAQHVALIAGFVVSASGLGNVLAAPRLGRLSDRVGPEKVLLACLVFAAIVMIPQAFVQNTWELMGLRFLMGLSFGGLLPSVNSLVRRSVPDRITGRIFGYNQSAQYLGNIAGPMLGGQMGAHFGLHAVFFSTSALLLMNAAWNYLLKK